MRVHSFKVWPDAFEAIWRGVKTFEARDMADRDVYVQPGDFVSLVEYEEHQLEDGETNYMPSGRVVEAFVPYVLPTAYNAQLGLPTSVQVFTIEKREQVDCLE